MSGLNAATVGRRYRTPAEFMRAEHFAEYARATSDLNPAYPLSGAVGVAPPVFAVRPLWGVCKQVVLDPEVGVDMLRLVHGEQDMVFHDVLRPWDLVAARAEILGIETKASGQVLSVGQRLLRDGEPVIEVRSAYFIRALEPAVVPSTAKAAEAPKAAPERRLIHERAFVVDADQSHRYAAASLDGNPIHTDPEVARAAGLPGIILHGVCTMALSGRELVDGLAGRDPSRLRRLKVRFSRMVLPGDTLTVRAWEVDETEGLRTVGFETLNQRGQAVLTGGLAELRTC